MKYHLDSDFVHCCSGKNISVLKKAIVWQHMQMSKGEVVIVGEMRLFNIVVI